MSGYIFSKVLLFTWCHINEPFCWGGNGGRHPLVANPQAKGKNLTKSPSRHPNKEPNQGLLPSAQGTALDPDRGMGVVSTWRLGFALQLAHQGSMDQVSEVLACDPDLVKWLFLAESFSSCSKNTLLFHTTRYFYIYCKQKKMNLIKHLLFWPAVYTMVSLSWKPEWRIALSWLQSRYPPKKTVNTNMMDVNVKQRWLQGDWFSSIQLAFLEGMTAVKANQPFTESQHVPHLLHVPSRSVPVYLSRSNMLNPVKHTSY